MPLHGSAAGLGQVGEDISTQERGAAYNGARWGCACKAGEVPGGKGNDRGFEGPAEVCRRCNRCVRVEEVLQLGSSVGAIAMAVGSIAVGEASISSKRVGRLGGWI